MSTLDPQLKRILVVDDEPNLRNIICKFLIKRGFDVVGAENGQQALERLQEQEFDLVLTDVYMPVLGGEELVTTINGSHPHLPIVAMTGFPEIEKAVKLMRSGVADYLRKPLKLSQLEMVVRAAMNHDHAVAELDLADGSPFGGTIGGYRILETLGKGSMGIVYKVHRVGDGSQQSFALKVLDPGPESGADENRTARERFLREAEIARRIDHENVVKLVDFGIASERGIPFMVMEFIEGQSLEYMIERQVPLGYHEKVSILLQVAEALAAIHQHDICHRDIKPGNILVTSAGRAKVTDFGLVRLPDSDLTGDHSVVGTPAYLAPEAYRHGRIDARGDLFSLGVVAYEFLLGHRPFDSLVFANLITQIETQCPLEPRKIDPGLPLPIQRILARLLRKDPDARYQTADEVVADFTSWLTLPQSAFASLFGRLQNLRSRDWR